MSIKLEARKHLNDDTILKPEGCSSITFLNIKDEGYKIVDETTTPENKYPGQKGEDIEKLDNLTEMHTPRETLKLCRFQYSSKSFEETRTANIYKRNDIKQFDFYASVINNDDDQLNCLQAEDIDMNSLLTSVDEDILETAIKSVGGLNLVAPTSCDTSTSNLLRKNDSCRIVKVGTGSKRSYPQNSDDVIKLHNGGCVKQIWPYRCDYCNVKFRFRDDLLAHIKEHSGNYCELCSKFFTDDHNFIVHLNFHIGRKVFRCYDCGLKLGSFITWMKHKKTHSNQPTSSLIPCRYCDKVFHRISRWSVHVRQHHIYRSQECPNQEPLKREVTKLKAAIESKQTSKVNHLYSHG